MQMGKGAPRALRADKVDVTQLLEEVEDCCLKEELEKCKQFLVDSEMKNGRRRVCNDAMDTPDMNNL